MLSVKTSDINSIRFLTKYKIPDNLFHALNGSWNFL